VIVGHLGVAAAVRSGWRNTSLLWLLAASVAPDLLDIAMAVGGICNPYGLYSHTVPSVALQAAVVGGAALLVTGSRPTAVASALLVLLHLPPDLLTGHKIYWPGGPMLGLDLYSRPLVDFVIEMPVLIAGWWLLRRSRSVPRWTTSVAMLVGLMAVQGAFDFLAGDGAKPNACLTVERRPL
jgi:hypothetical protein